MKTSPVTIALGCLLFLCLTARAGTSPSPSHAVPRIEITPNPAFIDQPVKIVLRDFPARQFVSVQLLSTNLQGQIWQSHAEFLTDCHGNADLATQAPISGTYRHADPAGLFWSISLSGSNGTALTLHHKKRNDYSLKPWRLTLTASLNGRTAATATIERYFLWPGVRQIQVRDQGIRGTLFLPAGEGPWPGVIVLGGSGGGLWDFPAAFLAAKGYAALALAYFNYEDLPKSLENVPLEYFQTSIHWLQARDDIRNNSIGVLGGSRGGELALLLGATFPEIRAVVAISPSSVLWGGIGTNAGASRQPAWTYQGEPLPFMNHLKLTEDERREANQLYQTNSEAAFTWFLIQHGNPAAVANATIAVEKINGPVLLISGNDDKIWPSTQMAEMIMKRVRQARHPFPDRHLEYPGAGHGILFPNMPATINIFVDPVTKRKKDYGGDPEDTAAEAADAWPRIVAFLNQGLNPDPH